MTCVDSFERNSRFFIFAQTPGISDETKRRLHQEKIGKLMLNLVNDTLTVSKSDRQARPCRLCFTEKISESITVPIREMADQKESPLF